MFWFSSCVYSTASLILVLRYADYSLAIGRLAGKVAVAGGDPLQPAGWGVLYGPFTMGLMLLGTFGAVWFARKSAVGKAG